MKDLDTKNRPVREAVARWAQMRGLGFSQAWSEADQAWHIRVGTISVIVNVAGEGRIVGLLDVAFTDKRMTTLLNRIEREALQCQR